MKHVMKDFNDISAETGPLVVVAITTWMLMSMFLGMFDDSVDAMPKSDNIFPFSKMQPGYLKVVPASLAYTCR